MHRLAATAIATALCACTPDAGPPTAPESSATAVTEAVTATPATSVLLFGDTGYDYRWPDPDDFEDKFSGRDFIINELDDWIEDKRPIEEFDLPPMAYSDVTGGYIMESGMWPVSKAVHEWCAPDDRCHFAVMLGDNIYPSGATLGADGRDDQQRFQELLFDPYNGLQEQDPEFIIYPVLGNHDWETSREGAELQIAYLEQSPLFHMDGHFYRHRAAPDVEVFAISTDILLAGDTVYEDALNDDGSARDTGEIDDGEPWAVPQGDEQKMLAWLEQSLADSDARWKLVIAHHPLWSSSGTKHEEAKVLRRLLMPALCRYADAYLVGHDHTLEVHTDDCRSEGDQYSDVPPLLQIVSGAAGKQRPVHSTFMAWQDREFPQKSTWFVEGLVWGFVEMVLEGDTATVQVVTTPDSGSGEPVPAFSRDFERRSGQLAAHD